MKHTKIILLSLASLALLASCGSNPSSSSSSSGGNTPSGDTTSFTFDGVRFVVKGDYSGSSIAYTAVCDNGSYSAITNLAVFNDVCKIYGYNHPLVGCEVTYTGTYQYKDGQYTSSTSDRTSAVNCLNHFATYNKAENKFVFSDNDEMVKTFYTTYFGDASRYNKVIASDGTLSAVSDLADGVTVKVTGPQHWLVTYEATKTLTVNYDYIGVYKA